MNNKDNNLVCFIQEREAYEGKTHFHVCSVDPKAKPMIITVHDIQQTREAAEEKLEQVKNGTHPTQTHPAGSLWLYKGSE